MPHTAAQIGTPEVGCRGIPPTSRSGGVSSREAFFLKEKKVKKEIGSVLLRTTKWFFLKMLQPSDIFTLDIWILFATDMVTLIN